MNNLIPAAEITPLKMHLFVNKREKNGKINFAHLDQNECQLKYDMESTDKNPLNGDCSCMQC